MLGGGKFWVSIKTANDPAWVVKHLDNERWGWVIPRLKVSDKEIKTLATNAIERKLQSAEYLAELAELQQLDEKYQDGQLHF